MIFAWGTGYKLSLYNVDHSATSAPAKVCTRGSDDARIVLDHAATDRPATIHTPVLIATFVSLDQASHYYPRSRRNDDAFHDLSPLSRAPVLYLRPPPQETRSLD